MTTVNLSPSTYYEWSNQTKGTIISSLYLPISIVPLFPFHQYQIHIANLLKKEKFNLKSLATFKEKICSWDKSYPSLLYTNLGIPLVNMKSPTHLPYTKNWTYADGLITGDSISQTITTRIGSNTNLEFEFEPNSTPHPCPSIYTMLVIVATQRCFTSTQNQFITFFSNTNPNI